MTCSIETWVLSQISSVRHFIHTESRNQIVGTYDLRAVRTARSLRTEINLQRPRKRIVATLREREYLRICVSVTLMRIERRILQRVRGEGDLALGPNHWRQWDIPKEMSRASRVGAQKMCIYKPAII